MENTEKSWNRLWAEKEIKIACKREVPDWDGKSFDYGCECYQSALRAYDAAQEMLEKDNHSGFSYAITVSILKHLLDGTNLTPITDEDFGEEYSEEWTTRCGYKSVSDCTRHKTLQRCKDNDGNVFYYDLHRVVGVDIENPSDVYHSKTCSDLIDELCPIEMPYTPSNKPYKVYTQTFLVNTKHGDFDTRAVMYIEDPNGKKLNFVPKYYTVGDNLDVNANDEWVEIDKDTYDELLEKRVDPLYQKTAGRLFNLIFTKPISEVEDGEKIWNDLERLCRWEIQPELWKYNGFDALYSISKGLVPDLGESTPSGIEELVNYCKSLRTKK